MNDRERFSHIMHYRPFDRCAIRDFGFWPETLLVWKQYGLPPSVEPGQGADDFFGMDRALGCGGITDLWPLFEEEVLQEKALLQFLWVDLRGVSAFCGLLRAAKGRIRGCSGPRSACTGKRLWGEGKGARDPCFRR